ncbi:MAG TPA: hypothetical protein VH024_11715 [Candidatus Angelobacter sp.]|jgi:hypothetical protein|nr:hypothetical protein [Candidatus Angelobacter sp.]
MTNSSVKKQGIAAHLRRLALLHGYEARMNRGEKVRLAEYQPMQNRGERVALLRPAPAVASQPAAHQHARGGKKGMSCMGCSGCGGSCNKKMLIPAAAALNGYMRRTGKSLGDLGFDFSDFTDAFSKIAPGVTSFISAAKGITTNPNAKAATPAPAAAVSATSSSSMPAWLLPAGAAAGAVGLLVAVTKR